jgi:hypothetical protein
MQCSFCGLQDGAAVTKNGRVACCESCAAPGGAASALVPEAAKRGILGPSNDWAAEGRPMTAMSLSEAARLSPQEEALLDRAHAARRRAQQEHRRMSASEKRLSLAACAIKTRTATAGLALLRQQQRPSNAKAAARQMVARLGLNRGAATK